MGRCEIKAAADMIQKADALLVMTGAGMGVDSGLGTFRGVNAGIWPPLLTLGIDYSDMSTPEWFDTDPCLAWAFWGHKHAIFTQSSPHVGYKLIRKWGSRLRFGLFSVTSNIDSHWPRTVGMKRVFEIHGSVARLQCIRDDGHVWPAENIPTVEWNLPPGEALEFRRDGQWHPGVFTAGGHILDAQGATVHAGDVRRRDGSDLIRVPEAAMPKCPETNALARPNVLMFRDAGCNCDIMIQQDAEYKAWLSALPQDARLVVLEIGAGKEIHHIRDMAEQIAGKFLKSTHVRINLEDASIEQGIGIGLGALEALSKIDAAMR